MSNKYEEFKTYLKKIGSGEFTGKSLTREETKLALKLMLKAVSYTHLTLPTIYSV